MLRLKLPIRYYHFPDIANRFPKNVIFSFTYGSGAFQQANQPDASKNMLDLVLVVDDLKQFHKQNLVRNRPDYSFVKYHNFLKFNPIFFKNYQIF